MSYVKWNMPACSFPAAHHQDGAKTADNTALLRNWAYNK